MEFIFSKDSDIIITDIKLYNVINEHKGEEIEQALKYFVKDKNLDINIIFNKKGKYKKIYIILTEVYLMVKKKVQNLVLN